MSQIRSKNTKPEEIVRKYLFSQGFRYRKNVKNLPGTPDIVLPKYNTVIFVNGCFWHMHNCDKFHWPKSNADYWHPKLMRNKERDEENHKSLEKAGWKIIVIWECELAKQTCEKRLNQLSNEIKL